MQRVHFAGVSQAPFELPSTARWIRVLDFEPFGLVLPLGVFNASPLLLSIGNAAAPVGMLEAPMMIFDSSVLIPVYSTDLIQIRPGKYNTLELKGNIIVEIDEGHFIPSPVRKNVFDTVINFEGVNTLPHTGGIGVTGNSDITIELPIGTEDIHFNAQADAANPFTRVQVLPVYIGSGLAATPWRPGLVPVLNGGQSGDSFNGAAAGAVSNWSLDTGVIAAQSVDVLLSKGLTPTDDNVNFVYRRSLGPMLAVQIKLSRANAAADTTVLRMHIRGKL